MAFFFSSSFGRDSSRNSLLSRSVVRPQAAALRASTPPPLYHLSSPPQD